MPVGANQVHRTPTSLEQPSGREQTTKAVDVQQDEFGQVHSYDKAALLETGMGDEMATTETQLPSNGTTRTSPSITGHTPNDAEVRSAGGSVRAVVLKSVATLNFSGGQGATWVRRSTGDESDENSALGDRRYSFSLRHQGRGGGQRLNWTSAPLARTRLTDLGTAGALS